MKKFTATTRAELERHLCGFVLTQILKGDGWCDQERCYKSYTTRFLETQIDNQSGADIFEVYKDLFRHGAFDGYNGQVFKKYEFREKDPEGESTEISTVIYITDAQLKYWKKQIKEAERAAEIEYKESQAESNDDDGDEDD